MEVWSAVLLKPSFLVIYFTCNIGSFFMNINFVLELFKLFLNLLCEKVFLRSYCAYQDRCELQLSLTSVQEYSARIYWVSILIILKSSVELDWGVPSKWNGLVSAHLYFFWHTHHLAVPALSNLARVLRLSLSPVDVLAKNENFIFFDHERLGLMSSSSLTTNIAFSGLVAEIGAVSHLYMDKRVVRFLRRPILLAAA